MDSLECDIDASCVPDVDFVQEAVVQLGHPLRRNFCTGAEAVRLQ